MASENRESDRITELELALTHLQKDYESLNEVVLDNGSRLASLESAMQRLTSKLDALSEPSSERRPEDEKPPHY